MEVLNNVLTWILEIGGTAVIVLGAVLWVLAALKKETTVRSFMALVFSFIFFIVLLNREGFGPITVRWVAVTYGGVIAFYIVGRMVEYREEIKAGQKTKGERSLE